MKTLRWMMMGATLAAGTAGAWQQQPDTRPQPPQQQGAQGMQAQEPRLSQEQWLAELMVVNGWATEMSQIAASQAVTPSVRQFAQRAQQDHQRFQQQLQQLAQRENIDVVQTLEQTRSDRQDFMHAAMLTSVGGLRTLTGENLDRAYLSSVVLSHDLAINKLQWAVKQVQNPRLTQAIQDEINSLSQHRQQAYTLLGQLAPKPRGQARRAPPGR